MKKIITIIFLIAVFSTGGLFAFTALAQENTYTVLTPLPGITSNSCDPNLRLPDPNDSTKTIPDPNCQTTLAVYIPALFNILIAASAVTAVLMIVIGGFQYMSTDAVQGKSAGKERIKNAIYGLVLVLSAWLILYTINPNLLNINLNIDAVTITAPTGAGGTLGVTELLTTTINARDALITACPNCVTVTSTTGGNHSVNSAHYQGRAIDIASNTSLNNYLTGSTNNPTACREVTRSLGGTTARFLWEPTGSTCGGTVPSSGDHWHMSVPGGSSGTW